MKTPLLILAVGGTLALGGFFLGQSTSATVPSKATATSHPDPSAVVARGRYLAHQVGMCIDCHSPRGADGRFIEESHLTGAILPFETKIPMPWAPVAPNLAGLTSGYTETAMIQFLMTGERPHGLGPARPPMPEVRLNREDATALTAYLRSLTAVHED